MFISSEGGHLDELRQLHFHDYDYSIVTEKTPATENLIKEYPGKVSYLTYGTKKNPFKYFFVLWINFFKSLKIFKEINPDVVVTTGTHTAVIMCKIAKKHGKKVIWIETYANRYSPTVSGKMMYNTADVFVVQWKEMLEVYPKAKYWGSIF